MGVVQTGGLTVRDFMSKNVLTAYSHSNVTKAIEIMADRNIGSVVVIDSAGPRGIFTERDLLSKVLTRNRRPETTLIMEVMSPLFADIGPFDSLEQAAKKMLTKKSRLMVFEGEDLAGIVTATDIVKAVHAQGRRFDISKVISRRMTTVRPDTPVESAVMEMDRKRVGSVIVVKDGKPWGIFTERDLLLKILAPKVKLSTPVAEVATTPLTRAEMGINGKEAADIMVSKRVKRLPLFEDDIMVGIVTARDLVEAFATSSR